MTNRNWISLRRIKVTAPTHRQVWHFIWDTALHKITPDKKSRTNSEGEFLTEYKDWDYDYDDHGNRYKCKTYTIKSHCKSALGHDRGRQATLGRVLGYNERPQRNHGSPSPGMGAYNGWHNGTIPRGDRAAKLLDIAGFDSFSHATFVWAGAGHRNSPVKHNKPLKRLYTKDLIKLAEANIENHLGDVCDGNSSLKEIHNEAYGLALDALCDADCECIRANDIATQVVKDYAEQL